MQEHFTMQTHHALTATVRLQLRLRGQKESRLEHNTRAQCKFPEETGEH